jgi:hypothetical protein
MLVNKIKHFGSSTLTLDLAYENCHFKNELNICTYIPFLTLKKNLNGNIPLFDTLIQGYIRKQHTWINTGLNISLFCLKNL